MKPGQRHARETLAVSIGVLALAVGFWIQNRPYHFPDSVFPEGIIGITGLLALVNGVQALQQVRSTVSRPSSRTPVDRRVSSAPLVIGLAATVVFFVSIFIVGFYTSTAGFLFGMYAFVGERREPLTPQRLAVALGMGIGVAGALYVVFTVLLGVQPPIAWISRAI